MKRIGIAVVERQGCVLVGIRAAQTVLPGLQEFPGGKCRNGESPAECAVRECFEETGLHVEVVELMLRRRHSYPHGEVDLSFYLCRPIDAAQPAQPFRWVPVHELPQLEFPAANQEVIQKLVTRAHC